MQLRPLGILKEILEEIGEDISYSYEDLVFTEHNAFLVVFNDALPSELQIYLNKDCEEKVGFELMAKIKASAHRRHFTTILKGKYQLHQEAGAKEFQLKFL